MPKVERTRQVYGGVGVNKVLKIFKVSKVKNIYEK